MHPVAVRILHPTSTDLGPLQRALAEARAANADRLAAAFRGAGVADVEVVTEAGRGGGFAALVRSIARSIRIRGLVLLGSGAIPLATSRDVEDLVAAASAGGRRALANNRYSADVIALSDASVLRDLPELPGDNALPRWLEEVAGYEVADLRGRWRLAVDLDSPLDVLLLGGRLPAEVDVTAVRSRLDALRAVAHDRRAELVVAGRTSTATLRWLERRTAGRVRALVEERGLRASAPAALAGGDDLAGGADLAARPPRSILGLALDDRGPAALATILAELGDAAIVDTRVLLAHRLGAEERRWPPAEERFASDLELSEQVADPWLRAVTVSAMTAPIPVLLGGHSLVGPGIRLLLGSVRRAWQ